MKDTFDRVVCVNLDRRPDRWARFLANVKEVGWPLKEPVRFRATDGLAAPPPERWISGPGAWGCMQSHRRILEEAIHDNLSSILVLEDDAYFPPEFPLQLEAFLGAVPEDWECLMIGGQHIRIEQRPPVLVGRGVLRCVNTQRTHAYALRGEVIKDLYRRWCSWTPGTTGHCDHILGPFMERRKAYAPADSKGRPRMLVGQFEGRSDIAAGREIRLTFWDPPDPKQHVYLVTDPEKPDPDDWRGKGLHMGYSINQALGVDWGIHDIFGKGRTRMDQLAKLRKWVDLLRWEAASRRPAAAVAVWLGPYHTDENVSVLKAVCGPLLQELSDVRAVDRVGVPTPEPHRGQANQPKRRRQRRGVRGGGRRRKP